MTGDTSFRDDAITLVGRAVLAPSSHNTQPWRFRVSDAVIDLFADRARALSQAFRSHAGHRARFPPDRAAPGLPVE